MKRHHVDALTVALAALLVFVASLAGVGAGLAWIAQQHGAAFVADMVAGTLE